MENNNNNNNNEVKHKPQAVLFEVGNKGFVAIEKKPLENKIETKNENVAKTNHDKSDNNVATKQVKNNDQSGVNSQNHNNNRRRFNHNNKKKLNVTEVQNVRQDENLAVESEVATSDENENQDTKQLNKNNRKKLKVIFLGGVGEIGKNMTALEYGNDIIVIDAGLSFPDEEMLGIDLVIPDYSYLIANKDKVRGIVVTHGHEDHIGALPFVLSDLSVPIYGSRLTMALVSNKMEEHKRVKYSQNIVKAGQVIKLGCFTVEFIHVNHSIAGAFALNIGTPVGRVVHTGDFKIDFCPIKDGTTDLNRFAELGKQGVQLLLCESTNVERKGYSMSESTVGAALDKLFDQYDDKRLFVATFASNVYRIQQILDLAEKYKRKVAFSGRSMINVSDTAFKIGELKFNKDILIDIDKVGNYKDSELLIISTGSQGEPMSALARMASGDFNKITIGDNDCIILSSSPIPGNEKSVYSIINKLYKLGALVIYHELADVHVSGHACSEELKTIHSLVKPKFFIPVHGEYRHLKLHQNLAISMGMAPRNTFIADLGNVVEISQNAMTHSGDVVSGKRLVDGFGVGDTEDVVLKDRKQMSEDGLCVVIINLSPVEGNISRTEIISRGFIYNDEQNIIITEAKQLVNNALDDNTIKNYERFQIKAVVRKTLNNFFAKKVKRRPMILTLILD